MNAVISETIMTLILEICLKKLMKMDYSCNFKSTISSIVAKVLQLILQIESSNKALKLIFTDNTSKKRAHVESYSLDDSSSAPMMKSSSSNETSARTRVCKIKNHSRIT